jgi:uncharacterized protein YukE
MCAHLVAGNAVCGENVRRRQRVLATSSRKRDMTMAQAIVDPNEIRRFAHNLKRFNSDLQDGLATLHGQLTSLGDTWRDQEHLKFVQQFEESMAVMQRFMELVNQHIPFLLRKAERVEEYLQQK